MKKAVLLCVLGSYGALALACNREAAPPTPPAAVPAAVPAAPAPVPVAPTPAPTPAATQAAPEPPRLCEVEIFGSVVAPKKAKGQKRTIYVAMGGDCLDDKAHILGNAMATEDDKFFIEVFPKWGTDLTICAAIDGTKDKPAKIYGKAAKTIHAEAVGEIMVRDLKIELKDGPPHVFPEPKNALD